MPEEEQSTEPFISTGVLPGRDSVVESLRAIHAKYRRENSGALSTVYPALGLADPAHFGLCLVGTSGVVSGAGDDQVPFTIMSVAKPFTYALACQKLGIDEVNNKVGTDATGLPFNSPSSFQLDPSGRSNPMVNAGAIATASLHLQRTVDDSWAELSAGLAKFAGRKLDLNAAVLQSARATNYRNRSLAMLLREAGTIEVDPDLATDLYTRQSCLLVTARDLAVMGATLADGGVNPITGVRVVAPDVARAALAAMTIAGMYETSGRWLMRVGVPGKSGIAGGIVVVSPGKGALGAYSPLLDAQGNSVRGQRAAEDLSRTLGLDILASTPFNGIVTNTDA